jgi:hypothetical protein
VSSKLEAKEVSVDKIQYFLRWFFSSHYRHLQIHEYETVSSIFASARIHKMIFVFLQGYCSILSFFNINIKVLFYHHFYRDYVELYVVYN